MRQIMAAEPTASKLCGEQTVKQSGEYRLTAHCLRVPCEDGTLLYHTMTGELLLLSSDETPEEYREELIRSWFLVPADYDEQQHVRDLRVILSLLSDKKTWRDSFTIFTTTDCNARCYYCFEAGISRASMSAETACDVAAYIARVSKGHEVKLSWFGGEPLYNIPAIETICRELERLGVAWWSIMTSNGYYLDEETARKAKTDWRVRRVQITLDGTREVYNRTKAYIDHDGDAYERVLRNIAYALSVGLGVTVRMNMDAKNVDNLLLLADELYARFGKQDKLDVMPVPLQPWAGAIRAFATEEECVRRFTALQEKLREIGYLREHALERKLFTNHCMADNDACETILPDGRVGKCDIQHCKDLIGSIYDDRRNEEMVRAWKEQAELPECLKCPMFPRCNQLKKCNWVKKGCNEANQTILLQRLKRQVLEAYHNRGNEEQNN